MSLSEATTPTEYGPGDLMKVSEVAATLDVNYRTVERYIRNGRLDVVRLGARTIRVTRESVTRFIEDGQGS